MNLEDEFASQLDNEITIEQFAKIIDDCIKSL